MLNTLAAATALVVTSSAMSQMASLNVGSHAPGLDIAKWVKGEQTTIEEGNVYIVEFWATWCAPCRKSIPHLTELQKDYEDQGLRIIGVSTEDEKTVSDFVRAQGAKMAYTVVVDNNNATERAWMRASNSSGIPQAFIVDRQGKIQYIGHPLSEEFDTIVSLVVRGRYDARLMRDAVPHLKAAETARKTKNWQLATKHLQDIYNLDKHIFAELQLEQLEMILVDMEDTKAGYLFANRIIEERGPADPELMSWLSRKIVLDPKIAPDNRNFDVAMRAAETALKYGRQDDPMPRATMAMVHYHKGELDKAVAMQTEAWMVASPKQKKDYKRVLDSYQRAATRSASNSNRTSTN